jgi:putative transposase
LLKYCLRLWVAHQQLLTMLALLSSLFKTSAELRLENLALRHQLGVLRRSAPKQLKLTPADRVFWVCLRRAWPNWKSALLIVKPATVIAWHRKEFRLGAGDIRIG